MSNFMEEEESPWGNQLSSSHHLGESILGTDDTVSPWGAQDDGPLYAEEDDGANSGSDKEDGNSNPYASTVLTSHDSFRAPLESPFHSSPVQAAADPLAALTAGSEGPSGDLHFVRQSSHAVGGDRADGAELLAKSTASPSRRRGKRTTVTVVEDPLAGQGDPLSDSVGPLGDSLGDPLGGNSHTTAKHAHDLSRSGELDEVPLAAAAAAAGEPDADEVRLAMSRVHLREGAESGAGGSGSSGAGSSGDTVADSVAGGSAADGEGADGLVGPVTPPKDDVDLTPPVHFEIEVGDPSRIGDLASAHTVYTINTSTDYARYPKSCSVQRRYRDFRWLYRALESTHPGVIVPAPPGKQAVGRFNEDFIEHRRAALEQMLRRVVKHPALYADADLEAFLASSDFSEYIKTRVIPEEEAEPAATSGGFMSSLGLIGRVEEPDGWLADQRARLDRAETELRVICRAFEQIEVQRKELSDSLQEFANVTEALAVVEPTARLGKALRQFAGVHEKLAAVYTRQRQQDTLSIGMRLEEQLRQVGSVRDALNARQRAASAVTAAGSELDKKRAVLEKLRRQGRTQTERQQAVEQEIAAQADKLESLQTQAAETTKRVNQEMARVSRENYEDLRNCVEIVVEAAVETQKEAIEMWETFYARAFRDT